MLYYSIEGTPDKNLDELSIGIFLESKHGFVKKYNVIILKCLL